MALHIKKPENVRPIAPKNDLDDLKLNLEILRGKALRAGAEDTAIIGPEDIVFSAATLERVAADDHYPSIHWPLHYPNDDIKEAMQAYRYGLFFRIAAAPGMPDYGGGPVSDPDHRHIFIRLYEIVTLLESACFYLGYHLAIGLTTGNCRSVFCHSEKRCQPMIKGMECIYPNKGRPSMEAVGINDGKMAQRLNWDGLETDKALLLAGLVMVD
jgi:predicted metal-binding protein